MGTFLPPWGVRTSASAPGKPISWAWVGILFLRLPPREARAARGPCRDHATWKDGDKGGAEVRAAWKPVCSGASREDRRVQAGRLAKRGRLQPRSTRPRLA